jgi:hypothetical protein
VGLAEVVEHERRGDRRRREHHRGQLRLGDHQLVDQAEIGNRAQAGVHGRIHQVVVGPALHLVADADQEVAAGGRPVALDRVAQRRVGQRRPADHAGDLRGGQRGGQELVGLVRGAAGRLDEDRPVDARRRQARPQVGDRVVAADRGQFSRGQPRVVGRPQVLVGVDDHRISPAASRSSHSSAGMS